MRHEPGRPRKWRNRFDAAHERMEFNVWRGAAATMDQSHVHTDIEVNYIERGGITYFAAGRLRHIRAGEMAVFWAGVPHELTTFEENTEMAWIVVPLAWFMQWRLPASFEQALLRGAFIQHATSEDAGHDTFLFRRWATELENASPEGMPEIRRITLLEVEARLRRLVREVEAVHPALRSENGSDAPLNETGATQIEKMARFISVHYREELSVQTIAQAVGLHPNYAMQLFREQSGISLWEYLTRLRISHAQRLLLTTDAKIERVAYESGFSSMARFYAAFKKYCNLSPRRWRLEYEEKIRRDDTP